jgi:hypothetical protein
MTTPPIDPRSDIFWQEEEERLWDALQAIALAAFLAGVTLGTEQIIAQVSGVSSAQVINLIGEARITAAAQSFLAEYQLANIANLTNTTRQAATSLINDWLASGDDISVLKESLATLPELSEGRASVIAVTENTRIMSEGKLILWNESGVIAGKTWAAVLDGKTTALCRALNGQTVPVNGKFVVNPADIASDPELADMVAAFGNTFDAPPAHPNCRSDIIPVVSERRLIRRIEEA